MNTMVPFVLQHDYSTPLAALCAHQISLPLLGTLCLLTAGALAAAGKLDMVPALRLAVTACVLADCVRNEASRQYDERVLHIIHRVSPRPAPPEKWPVECIEHLLRRQLNIFCEINHRFLTGVKVVS